MTLLWKPLLAATLPMDAELDALPYPLWGSPKIDGVRCMVQRGVVVSRKGIPIRNKAVQEIYGGARSPYEGLDGELVIGKPYGADTFLRTTDKGRGVNNGSEEAADWFRRYGKMWVIDIYNRYNEQTFEDRQRRLHEEGALAGGSNAYVEVIEQRRLRSAAQLLNFEDKCLAKGYEGVMLRRADSGPYPQKPGKENRSTLRDFWLVKFKRFDYAEARVVAVHPLEHNLNEEKTAAGKRSTRKSGLVVDERLMGSVSLESLDGNSGFNVTLGSAALRGWPGWGRPELWKGAKVRYKFFPTGAKGAPRFPTCEFLELLSLEVPR